MKKSCFLGVPPRKEKNKCLYICVKFLSKYGEHLSLRRYFLFREKEQIYKRFRANIAGEIANKSFLIGTKHYLPNKNLTLNLIHTKYYIFVILHILQEGMVIKLISWSHLNIEFKPPWKFQAAANPVVKAKPAKFQHHDITELTELHTFTIVQGCHALKHNLARPWQ
jgi:hypothetical protein